ncbi:MAG: penicillin-binding protein activator LpoB [Planctomycetes bacterium]|nr:penicillin-binding protein activator LpoB [Planctomycetota bacterium]
MAYLRWAAVLVAGLSWVGCRQPQGRLMGENEDDLVGARQAGAAAFNRLIEEATTKLLNRQSASKSGFAKNRIAFVALENKSIEELGDFKEQIYQVIDTVIETSDRYEPISVRYIEAGLKETALRPDQLFIPRNMRAFAGVLETQGQPVDYLLYATLTSGTTSGVEVRQRDYLLTMELVHIATGKYDKESARVRKEYVK